MDTLWTDYINSHWHDWRGSGLSEDRLSSPKWQASFLKRYGLTAPVPASPEELVSMHRLRIHLRDMVHSFAETNTVTDAQIKLLNEYLAKGTLTRKLRRADSALQLEYITLSGADWSLALAEVAANFAETVARGSGDRIRICGNPDCRWIFYDDTRSRTKRYCEEKSCGNLMKVRRFRAKHKQE
ncbi:CGNR zinc finger domain-containing protein [Paenibacillus gansuensis]|uniref:CGNR zinc finger domain-containing protein n=1 Tax=Paenibacillus gansuensis TaxID=306542 RepID=A0ABW5PGP9_9BACL